MMQSPLTRTDIFHIISGDFNFQSLCPNFLEYLAPFLSAFTEIFKVTISGIRRSAEGTRLTSELRSKTNTPKFPDLNNEQTYHAGNCNRRCRFSPKSDDAE
jgi:hypothetical protein